MPNREKEERPSWLKTEGQRGCRENSNPRETGEAERVESQRQRGEPERMQDLGRGEAERAGS